MELGWPDADGVSTGRLLSLCGAARLRWQLILVAPSQCRCFGLHLVCQEPFPGHCASFLVHPVPDAAGVSPESPPGRVRRWFNDNVRGRLGHDLPLTSLCHL